MSSEFLELPRVFPLQQYFPRPRLKKYIVKVVSEQMCKLFAPTTRFDGMKIGVTANSRGILDQVEILRAVVAELRARGASVFIVPAIGSHGGGTAEGEMKVLAALGVTPESIGAEFLPGVQTREITNRRGVSVHCSTRVLDELDAVFVVGRVKEHTDIYWSSSEARGPLFSRWPSLCGLFGQYWGLESGPHKSLAIGLAKLHAAELHAAKIGLGQAVEFAARCMLSDSRVNVIGGLGIVENAYDETALIEALPVDTPDSFFRKERQLLDFSKTLLPHLPWPTGYYDLVYVYRAGKPIAGQGVHTKALGVPPNEVTPGEAWGEGMPAVHTIVCSTLQGTNAMGRGKFRYVNRRYVENMDEALTQTNAKAAGYPAAAVMPEVVENDRALLESALKVCTSGPNGPRIAFIVSTMWMENVWLSEAFYKDAQGLDPKRARIVNSPRPIAFDSEGNIDLPTLAGAI